MNSFQQLLLLMLQPPFTPVLRNIITISLPIRFICFRNHSHTYTNFNTTVHHTPPPTTTLLHLHYCTPQLPKHVRPSTSSTITHYTTPTQYHLLLLLLLCDYTPTLDFRDFSVLLHQPLPQITGWLSDLILYQHIFPEWRGGYCKKPHASTTINRKTGVRNDDCLE